MSIERAARLQGLFNITVTPFAADGSIDFPALADAIERMIGLRFDGILVGGTYGEFPAMSPDERAALFRRTIDIVRDRIPVMLCSAASDPRTAQQLTELAANLGGYPMVTAPYVSEITDEQIIEYFRWMAPSAASSLIVYNAPGIGITLSPRTLERLAQIEGAVALKQGDLSPTAIDEIANRLSGRIRLFCASDLAFLGPMTAGFDGLSSTNSCAFPELISSAFRAIQAGDAALAIKLHRRWFSFRELARTHGQPQTVKAAMRVRGWGNGAVRSPLQAVPAAHLPDIERVTRDILSTWESSRADRNFALTA